MKVLTLRSLEPDILSLKQKAILWYDFLFIATTICHRETFAMISKPYT